MYFVVVDDGRLRPILALRGLAMDKARGVDPPVLVKGELLIGLEVLGDNSEFREAPIDRLPLDSGVISGPAGDWGLEGSCSECRV